jgi:hypothetical protein
MKVRPNQADGLRASIAVTGAFWHEGARHRLAGLNRRDNSRAALTLH